MSPTETEPETHKQDPSRTRLPLESHQVVFQDLRNASEPPAIEREGFILLEHRSEVTDFGSRSQLETIYLPEIERVVRQMTGSSRVFASGLIHLRSSKHARKYDPDIEADGPALLVHTDMTDRSVRVKAQVALRRHGVEEMPKGRLAVYNSWRSLTPPPQDYLLGLCDLRTVKEEDLVRANAYGESGAPDWKVEYYVARRDPGHRWCYFSDMKPDELLMFQQYDSDGPGPSSCPHTSFRDPDFPPGTKPRLSIEAAAYVFFD